MTQERVIRALIIVLLCGMLVYAAVPASAASQVRIVRLSYVQGNVQIDRNTGQGFERAITNMPITQGMKLWTREDARAEIEFEDGTTVRVTQNTRINFSELALLSNEGRLSSVNVAMGVAYFDVRHKNHDDFNVSFGDRTITLDRSAYFRVDAETDQVKVAVFDGQVKMKGLGREVAVKKGETLSFDLNDTAKYVVAKGIEEFESDTWAKARKDYYAQNGRRGRSYGGSPIYGWSDLNYYGRFYNVSGYGNLWRPYGVGYSWDPFMDGAWAWYPNCGYMWVSTNPWGWTPYRYGSWTFVPGWGWAWQPGRVWNNWWTTPSVHNPPPWYHLPPPPVVKGTPTTVIVTNPDRPRPRFRDRPEESGIESGRTNIPRTSGSGTAVVRPADGSRTNHQPPTSRTERATDSPARSSAPPRVSAPRRESDAPRSSPSRGGRPDSPRTVTPQSSSSSTPRHESPQTTSAPYSPPASSTSAPAPAPPSPPPAPPSPPSAPAPSNEPQPEHGRPGR